MKSQNLGFDKEQMLVLPTQGREMMKRVSKNLEAIKEGLTSHHSVVSATATLRTPGRMTFQDNVRLLGEEESKKQNMTDLFVDHDFLDTYGIDVVAGRAFQREIASDVGKAFMINEAAVTAFGWTSPEEAIGKRLSFWMGKGEIIGVCKNFHYWSLHREIEPLFFLIPSRLFPETISLKLNASHLPATVAFIESKWKEIFPDYPFEYHFLDEDFNRLYHGDERFGEILLIFTGLAILIACLGLFALAFFATEQRTKEIGVRKALGASVSGIIQLLSREFSKQVVLANLVAWPIAYYFMSRWLQNFAYRIDLSIWTFLLGGAVTLVVAMLSMSYQAVRAAMADPVHALRYE